MNVSYEVKNGYLYVIVTGEFDKAATCEMIYDWIENARARSLNRILYDITLMTGFDAHESLAIDRFTTGWFITSLLPKDFRLAILETPKQLERTVFNENIIVDRRTIVKATSDLHKALEWLGVISTPDNIE